ncbi:TolC family protein [Rhodanobacter aciditrophus]|uniref:TolC family protein n=1 Tax=Rhodanobacter aciditrophus TaxID=1623218 RepID=A0ABW4AZS7_9GAMM
MQGFYRSLVALGITSASTFATANQYPIGLEQVYQSALSGSNEYRAMQQESLSSEALLDAEQKYYLPKAALIGEWNRYYGEEELDPNTEDTLTLNIDMTLWGSGVSDRKDAARYNHMATDFQMEEMQLSIYQDVLRYLAKIERIRDYLDANEAIGTRLDRYVQRQRVASNAGSAPFSDLREAELEQSRYHDTVSRVRARIDQMFRALREETNYWPEDPNQVGLSDAVLTQLLAEDISAVDIDAITRNNYGLQGRQLQLDAQLSSAQAQRERFRVSLVNETQLEVMGDDNWDSGDVKSDSFVGIKATYDLFNYQNSKSQQSALYLYEAEKERFDRQMLDMSSRLNALQEEYREIQNNRDSLLGQIALNESLVEAQESELLIDKLDYVDIIKSLASLNQSYVTLLDYDLALTDAVVDTLELSSKRLTLSE